MTEHRVPITRQTWSQFRRAVSDFANCEVRWRARGLFALLIALLFAFNGLNVLNDILLTGTPGTIGTEQSDGTIIEPPMRPRVIKPL